MSFQWSRCTQPQHHVDNRSRSHRQCGPYPQLGWPRTNHEDRGSSGTATGLGDIVVRTKYRFFESGRGGLAAGLDLRLPTGDKENLLGTGSVQTKLLFIASGEFSRVAPHVNFGYTYSHGDLSSSLTTLPSSSQPANAATQAQINGANATLSGVDLRLPNEVNYVAGVDIAAHPLVTISADMIGRSALDSPRYANVSRTYQYRTANSGPLQSATRDTFDQTGTGSLNLLLGVVGAKVNIPGTPLLLTGSVLFPLTNSGLRPHVTPVVGLDYSFKRLFKSRRGFLFHALDCPRAARST